MTVKDIIDNGELMYTEQNQKYKNVKLKIYKYKYKKEEHVITIELYNNEIVNWIEGDIEFQAINPIYTEEDYNKYY